MFSRENIKILKLKTEDSIQNSKKQRRHFLGPPVLYLCYQNHYVSCERSSLSIEEFVELVSHRTKNLA